MQKFLNSFLYIIGFLLAVAVSIKSLREPDIWWQIRTGEWILAHKNVPKVDVFSFTHDGQGWINIKWGFEVLAALISRHLGPESVFILQIIACVLILFFIKKILGLFKLDSPALFITTAVLLLFGIEYRIIGRPEMCSHLMEVIFLYLLLLYHNTGSRLIYLLIPLQILWCNMHEAYATGIVMLLIYTLTAWGNSLFLKTEKPLQISLITFLSICAVMVNPRGILLLTRPFNIFSQVQQNKYTTELDSFFSADYWHKESYLFVIAAVIFIIFLIKKLRGGQLKNKNFIFPPEYLAICLAFLVLSFTAYRNIIFFLLAIAPFIAYFIHTYFSKIENYKLPLAIISVCIYILIVSNKYYELTNSRDRFGLEVLSVNNPVGAADFIEQKQLKTKKCFSDYLTSSYLLWKLQPEFKTFIDLRDLDIFSTDFFEKYLGIINDPAKYYALDQKEHFEYVVLYRRSNEALHQYLYNDSIYACVFVDPVAAVYQKTDNIPPGDIFRPCYTVSNHIFADIVNKVFNPLYQSYDYDHANYDFEAASYYTNVGKISLAEKRINQYLYMNPANQDAINLKNQVLNLKSKINK